MRLQTLHLTSRPLIASLVVVLLAVGLGAGSVPASAVVPGANGKIVFASNRTTSNTHLWGMNGDGGDPTLLDPPLTCDPGDPDCNPGTGCPLVDWQPFCNVTSDSDLTPGWSPDGTKILFESSRSPDGPRFDHREVFVMNGDGTGVARLTNEIDQASIEPTWSPDGSEIAFARYHVGMSDVHLWVMNSDGTGQVQLTNDANQDGRPAWSPDGTQIVFVRSFFGFATIWLMDADGSNQHQINGNGRDPGWSPDGTKIVFSGPGGLWTMNPDGSGMVNVGDNPYNYYWPAWAPDGTKILYSLNDSGIHVIDADGSGDTDLTSGAPGLNTQPDWQAIAGPPPVSADLSITKVDSPDPVWSSQRLTYTVTVSNGGPSDASEVTVTDTLPASVRLVSATPSQGSCSGSTIVTCDLEVIPSGGSATVTIVVKPKLPGMITNSAAVSAAEADPDLSNNSATQETTVKRASITLTPTSGPPGTAVQVTGAEFAVGEEVRLTFIDSARVRTKLGLAIADGAGGFVTDVVVPGGASVGMASVQAQGMISRASAKARFKVT